jgi:large subunit ribosomal protein L34e
MASNRVTYLRRKSYNTRSNKIRKHRTPGGRLTIKYVGKRQKGVQPMGETKSRISGLKKLNNTEVRGQTYTQRSISRAYGGVLTPKQLKERILKAFICTEVQISKCDLRRVQQKIKQ